MTSPSRLSRFPRWISRWLGYRSTPPPPKPPQYIVYVWSFIGAFCGLALLQAVFGHSKYFVDRSTVPVVASFVSIPPYSRPKEATNSPFQGASAVLCFGAIETPVAQPRALVFGQFISALIGVCITKLFAILPKARFESLQWLAGSLSAATALVAMQITNTIHPPAGATALLVATNSSVFEMGWYYLPVVLLSSMLMLVTALLIDNIQRRYPVFWIEPVVPPPAPPDKKNDGPVSTSASSNDAIQTTNGAVTQIPKVEV